MDPVSNPAGVVSDFMSRKMSRKLGYCMKETFNGTAELPTSSVLFATQLGSDLSETRLLHDDTG